VNFFTAAEVAIFKIVYYFKIGYEKNSLGEHRRVSWDKVGWTDNWDTNCKNTSFSSRSPPKKQKNCKSAGRTPFSRFVFPLMLKSLHFCRQCR
jgi:hypothetical protein